MTFLTPHVLSEWMVEVCAGDKYVVFDSSFGFVLAFERLVFDVWCYIIYYIITIIILLYIISYTYIVIYYYIIIIISYTILSFSF